MKFLEKNGLKTAQTCFRDIFQNNIHRNYADDLLAWLERETDFFEAPASTRNHGAHPGGLLVHSLNVYRRLRAIVCVENLRGHHLLRSAGGGRGGNGGDPGPAA